jgi:hypothetical protein
MGAGFVNLSTTTLTTCCGCRAVKDFVAKMAPSALMIESVPLRGAWNTFTALHRRALKGAPGFAVAISTSGVNRTFFAGAGAASNANVAKMHQRIHFLVFMTPLWFRYVGRFGIRAATAAHTGELPKLFFLIQVHPDADYKTGDIFNIHTRLDDL